MDENEIKIPLGLSLMLFDVINSLLYKEISKEDGTKETIERELPFRLKYNLIRNRTPFKRDMKIFEDKKMLLLAKYGTPNPEKMTVELTSKENYDNYVKGLQDLLDTEITHSVRRLDPEDLDIITENIDISVDAMDVLIGYLTNDQALVDDIYRPITFNVPEFKETKKEEISPKDEENKKNSSSNKNESSNQKEVDKDTDVKKVPVKKATTTKTNRTSTKTTPTKKATSTAKTSVKKTTPKKTTTTKKKVENIEKNN